MSLKEKIIFIVLFFSVAFFILPKIVFAQVVFNEIAWMGTTISTADEWMELYNNSDNTIDLTGWKIVFLDINLAEKFTINFSSDDPIKQISGHEYFLLERTDNDTVPNIAADKIYTGALNNEGGFLKLFDTQNNLIDEINASNDWPAGDRIQKLTMERAVNGTWQNSANTNGTPKSPNSGGLPRPRPRHLPAPPQVFPPLPVHHQPLLLLLLLQNPA